MCLRARGQGTANWERGTTTMLARRTGKAPPALVPSSSDQSGPPTSLPPVDQQHTGDDEQAAAETCRREWLLGEADPPARVEHERGDHLTRDDGGDERGGAQPRREHDGRGDVERAEQAPCPLVP